MRHRQTGSGLWSTLLFVAMLGSAGYVGLKLLPLYLNEWRLEKALHEVAKKPELAYDSAALRLALQRRWDIDEIRDITPEAIVAQIESQRPSLNYDYVAQAALTQRISVQIRFSGSVPLQTASGQAD